MIWLGTDIERSVRQSLFELVPSVYKESKVVTNIIETDAKEIERLYAAINDVMDQFFVTSATWGLSNWERILNIPIIETDSYEKRRIRILSKLSGNVTFGVNEAETLAKQFSEAKNYKIFSEIKETHSFETAYYVDDIEDIENIYAGFEEVKPAHLKHIMGLIILLPYSSLEKASFIIDTVQKIIYDSSLKGKTLIDVFSASIKKVFLEGLFSLDGSIKLDGENEKGTNTFYERKMKLNIIIFKDGQEIENTIV